MTPEEVLAEIDEDRELGFEPSRLGLSLLLRDAHFAVRRCLNAHCVPFDCNGDQFVLLKLLADEDGVTQQDLVDRAGYDASTTANMLNRLESNGLIQRDEHPDDARAKLVSLTKEGRRLQRKLWKESETLRRRLWECVPLEDRSIVTDGLRRIAAEMEQFKADFDGSQ